MYSYSPCLRYVYQTRNVFTYGIETVSQHDFQYAREKGYHLKLVAQSRRTGNNLSMSVLPQFVNADHKLYQVSNEYNGVEVEGVFSDKQFSGEKVQGASQQARQYYRTFQQLPTITVTSTKKSLRIRNQTLIMIQLFGFTAGFNNRTTILRFNSGL